MARRLPDCFQNVNRFSEGVPYARHVNDLLTSTGSRPAPERALLVVAHPDDIDFGAAGTVAALTSAGTEVAYCLVTSGDAGSDHLPIGTDELVALREREQTEAAAVVGVPAECITFLRHPDGLVEPTPALRCDITAAIRRHRPDVVIAQSPDRLYSRIFASHPDHLAAGEATLCAVYPDARNPFTFTDIGLDAWTVREIWYSGGPDPDHFVDITDVFDRKRAAMECMQAQEHLWRYYTELAQRRGTQAVRNGGRKTIRYAEAFQRVYPFVTGVLL